MPASFSAPIEPYLKRISGVAVTQSGCGSSRNNLAQAMVPRTAPRTSRASISHSHQGVPRVVVTGFVAMGVSARVSERLQVRDQRVLVGRGQIGAVGRAFVAC